MGKALRDPTRSSWLLGGLLLGAAGRQLDEGEPPAVDQANLQRAPGLLVNLRDAVVPGGGAADVAPGVRLQRGPHGDAQALDLQPTPIHEPCGLHGRRLDDRRFTGLVREPPRHRNVFELAPNRPGGTGGAPGREREDEERGGDVLNVHVRSLSGPPRRRKEIRDALASRPDVHVDALTFESDPPRRAVKIVPAVIFHPPRSRSAQDGVSAVHGYGGARGEDPGGGPPGKGGARPIPPPGPPPRRGPPRHRLLGGRGVARGGPPPARGRAPPGAP